MKKIYTIVMFALLPLLTVAQGWPASYGGVMLQGFFWDDENTCSQVGRSDDGTTV